MNLARHSYAGDDARGRLQCTLLLESFQRRLVSFGSSGGVLLVFFVAGLVLALDIAGATALLGTILGAAGIVGLAVGFAVRDTIENYVASLMLSLRQPFRANDLVKIDEFEGRVIRLT